MDPSGGESINEVTISSQSMNLDDAEPVEIAKQEVVALEGLRTDYLYEDSLDASGSSFSSPPFTAGSHLCSICGDLATGYHYSCLSCEGCKGFFKRTIQRGLVYRCKENESCVINKFTRNSCQYCRYQRCLAAGMRREMVREDHMPGAAKHVVRRSRFLDPTLSGHVPLPPVQRTSVAYCSSVMTALLNARADQVGTGLDPAEPLTADALLSCLADELRVIVQWATKLPDLMHFSMSDRCACIRSSLPEILLLRIAHRSSEYADCVKVAEGAVLTKEQSRDLGERWVTSGGHDLVSAAAELSSRLREGRLDRAEFSSMCGLLLTSPDAPGLSARSGMMSLQSQFLDALAKYVYSNQRSVVNRFPKLLLRLPTIRTLAARVKDRLMQAADPFLDEGSLEEMIQSTVAESE